MTTHERRVMALMRFHGLSKAEAEKRARSLAAKKNPVKRKTQARTQSAAEDYVYRRSQVTKKAPSKRLIKRRTINLQTRRGVFPNPKTRSSLEKTSSWVIRNKKTGEVIMETFDIKKVNALNTAKYEAVPILKYLQELNSGIKKNPSSVHFDIDVNSHNARGAKANPVKKRVTSRPHRSARKMVYCVESGQSDKGPWRSEGIFPNEAKARNYAEALSASNPGVWLRVVLK